MEPVISITAPTPTNFKPNVHGRIYRTTTFFADAALFDMDGTLTDSIAAVEAAWARVAQEIGADPAFVIAATHGKRAIDNLARFKPHLHPHELGAAVDDFERSILFYADAYARASASAGSGPGSCAAAGSSTPSLLSDAGSGPNSTGSSCASSPMQSAMASTEQLVVVPESRVELADELAAALTAAAVQGREGVSERVWELEAAQVDRAVRIAHGCLSRVGITPPKVTITADDPRLRAGKPAPDPFLLAAGCLGYSPSRCVVFEDSPNGIRAGVAAGAIVVAVCTSHSREQIGDCGAHFVVENLEEVRCEEIETEEGTRLMFTVEH